MAKTRCGWCEHKHDDPDVDPGPVSMQRPDWHWCRNCPTCLAIDRAEREAGAQALAAERSAEAGVSVPSPR